MGDDYRPLFQESICISEVKDLLNPNEPLGNKITAITC